MATTTSIRMGGLAMRPKHQAASGGQYGHLLATRALAAAVTLPPPAGEKDLQRFVGPGPGKLHAKFGGPEALHSAAVGGTS